MARLPTGAKMPRIIKLNAKENSMLREALLEYWGMFGTAKKFGSKREEIRALLQRLREAAGLR
jgi:hypothetical protein